MNVERIDLAVIFKFYERWFPCNEDGCLVVSIHGHGCLRCDTHLLRERGEREIEGTLSSMLFMSYFDVQLLHSWTAK